MKFPSTFILLIALVSGCGKGNAGYSSRGEPSATFPTAQPASGAYVVVPADSRVFMVQIKSKQEVLADQLSELIAARDAVLKGVKPTGEMLSFQVGEPGLHAEFAANEKRNKQDANALMLRISFKIPADPLKQVSDFVKAIDAIKSPTGSQLTYSLRGMEYDLTSPENHREKLVAKAMQDLRGLNGVDTKQFKVSVTGLEKPLAVSQYSDHEFLVSLQYSVVVESISGAAGSNVTGVQK